MATEWLEGSGDHLLSYPSAKSHLHDPLVRHSCSTIIPSRRALAEGVHIIWSTMEVLKN